MSRQDKEEEMARTSNAAVYDQAHPEQKCRSYSWLEDYLVRLNGKDAYREFQERCCHDPEYYTLVASLAA
jgi:hypothetical protein